MAIRDIKPPIERPLSPLYGKIRDLPRGTIENTDAFAKGLLRLSFNEEDVLTGVIDTFSGAVFETLGEALNQSSRTAMESLDVLTGASSDRIGYGPLSDLIKNINRVNKSADPGKIGYDIFENAKVKGRDLELVRIGWSDLNKNSIAALAEAAAQIDGNPDGMGIGTYANEIRKVGPPGFLTTNGENASLLTFRSLNEKGDGYEYLTGQQTRELLTATDNSPINIKRISRILQGPIEENIEHSLAADMGKMEKRMKSYVSDRNFSIRQDDVNTMLESLGKKMDPRFRGQAPKSLEDAFLKLDSPLQTLLRAFGTVNQSELVNPIDLNVTDLEHSYNNLILRAAGRGSSPEVKEALRHIEGVKLAMAAQNETTSNSFLRFALDSQRTDGLTLDYGDFSSFMKKTITDLYTEKGGAIEFGDIVKRVGNQVQVGKVVDPTIRAYHIALNQMKKIQDGSSTSTVAIIEHHIGTMKARIGALDTRLLDPKIGVVERAGLEKSRLEIRSSLGRVVENSQAFLDDGAKPIITEATDQTMRILLGEYGHIKVVTDIIGGSLAEGYEKLGLLGVIPAEGYKSDVIFGGSKGFSDLLGPNAGRQITFEFSGSSHGAESVYDEAQARIFHGEAYGPEYLDDVKSVIKTAKSEIEELKSGKISESLRASIGRDANIDIESSEVIERLGRAGAIKVRDAARELQIILANPNLKVNEIPDLLNRLADQVAMTYFKTDQRSVYNTGLGRRTMVNTYKPLLPNATRTAVDTESRAAQSTGRAIILGGDKNLGGVDAMKTIELGGENSDMLNIFRSRFDGHKFIIPDAFATSFGGYEAGGGFDLDDKFINNIRSVMNRDGKRELVSFAWRQPTGPQEFTVLSPYLDDKTLTRILGSETELGRKFRGMSSGISNLIDKRSGFNPGISNETFEGLNDLSREEKLFKYLNSLSYDRQKTAAVYKTSLGEISQQEITDAFFKLSDAGTEETFGWMSMRGSEVISRNEFAESLNITSDQLGERAAKIQPLQHDTLRRLNVLNNKGTPMSLTADEILRSGDAGMIATYRESSIMQMVAGNTTFGPDEVYHDSIKSLWEKNSPYASSQSYNEYLEAIQARGVTPTGERRILSKMELSGRALGDLLSRR